MSPKKNRHRFSLVFADQYSANFREHFVIRRITPILCALQFAKPHYYNQPSEGRVTA